MTQAQLLENKVALVTGASSGIGEAAAIALADAGASVVLGARRQEKGEAVAQRIRDAGGKAVFLKTDVTNQSESQALVDLAVSEFGGLDIAFNNAGTDGQSGPITDVDDSAYDNIFDTNVKGVWNALRAQIPALKNRGGGSIINTSSILGTRGVANMSTYAASKFAVEGLTKSVSLEVAKDNIRINAVAPGPIITPLLDNATGGNTDGFNGIIPQGRPGTTDEISPSVVFLASDLSSYITGHSLEIGGGATAGFVTG
jgi:NAD(P)-dependent dehydrogenase (short-subunit alcohol dehydrogenase family)